MIEVGQKPKEGQIVSAIRATLPDLMWAGSDQSLAIAREIYADLMAGFSYPGHTPDEEEDSPYNFSMNGDVGVITIRGPLLNIDSEYARYRGATTYADIRRALVFAANKPEVKAIMMDVDSGGGAVSGVSDTGDLIANIDRAIKPIHSFSDGVMASAAYWLGVSSGKVYASKTAIMGSIGVITTHTEYSKMYKAAGIGVTVIRAGEFKALANSAEPLSDEGLKQMQQQLDGAYGVFIGHVAGHLGMSVDKADSQLGQGREFFGQAAVQAGLAMSVETYDSLMARIQAKVLDTSNSAANNVTYPKVRNDMTRAALSDQHVAAIAAGAVAPGAPAVVVPAVPAVVTEPAATAAVTAPVTTAAIAPATPASAVVDQSAIVNYLQTQLVTANASALDANVKLAAATTRLAELEAIQAPLLKIAAQSVTNMRIGLNMAVVDLSALSATALLADHTSMTTMFQAKYPVGGVAAVTHSEAGAKVVDHQTKNIVVANRYVGRGK